MPLEFGCRQPRPLPNSHLVDQIIMLVLARPEVLYPVLADVVTICRNPRDATQQRAAHILLEGLEPVDESERIFASLLRRMIETEELSDCRALVLEELVRRVGPFVVLSSRWAGSRCRVHDHGEYPCGDWEIDVVFSDPRSGSWEFIECKVRLETWLHGGGKVTSLAQRKLGFFRCLRRLFSECRVEVVLATFQSDVEMESEALRLNGFSWIAVADRSAIFGALRKRIVGGSPN